MSKLTVLVFKDHLASRSFELNPRWLTWFGVWNLTLVLVTASSLTWGVRNWWILKQSSPASDVSSALQSHAVAPQKQVLETPQEPSPSSAPLATSTIDSAVQPSQPQAPATVSSAPPHAMTSPQPAWAHWSPRLLAPTEGEPKSIQVENVRLRAATGTTRIQFDLVYVKKDGATQRGVFIVLGKTANGVVSYPKTALSQAKAPDTVQFERGESFAVSRQRPVDAKLESASELQEIEILVLDRKGTVLHHMVRPMESKPNPEEPRATTHP